VAGDGRAICPDVREPRFVLEVDGNVKGDGGADHGHHGVPFLRSRVGTTPSSFEIIDLVLGEILKNSYPQRTFVQPMISGPMSSTSAQRLLSVDDRRSVISGLTALLEDDYEIRSALTGRTALQKFGESSRPTSSSSTSPSPIPRDSSC